MRLITLDPGHFHASLVQKFMYPDVSPAVNVYAPAGADLQEHLARIESFNSRTNDPTHWQEKVYKGPDFLERMLSENGTKRSPGLPDADARSIVVIAGNNARKTEYISRSVDAGLNVLADKPMAINPADFLQLQKAFQRSVARSVLLYDIMTERYEVSTILQRELSRMPEIFGTLQKGTAEDPAVVMESVHNYFKEVAGKPLIRPAWSFDVRQQGEGIPDVGTHLVDLVQWECFPEQSINWRGDLRVREAHRWATKLTPGQFKQVTGLDKFPDYLKQDVDKDGNLDVFANGNVSYSIRGVHAKVTALWNFQAPAGAGDTHYSLIHGSNADLLIKQGAEQHFVPTLYVVNKSKLPDTDFETALRAALGKLSDKWPGIDLKSTTVAEAPDTAPADSVGRSETSKPRETPHSAFEITIPDKYRVGHEAHFAQVTASYLRYLKDGKFPDWEIPNMLAKYFITTQAYAFSHHPPSPGKLELLKKLDQ